MRRRRGGERRPRTLSIHARLFFGFGAALTACSALMVAIIYVGIRYLPTYDFTTPIVVPQTEASPPSVAPPCTSRTSGVRRPSIGATRSTCPA
ncbi:hypothetical protein LV779_23635 [Streptomyces thinghirensis]|nr:hypothetical protein [Streptomyces thinghirensis]